MFEFWFQDMHSAFCDRLTSPQTSPVLSVLLLEPFLEPQMYMNSGFLIFLLVSLSNIALGFMICCPYSRHAMDCQKAGKNDFPLWSYIAISISHLLLVVNSSTNIFIYCFMSSAFREECSKLYQSICRKVCVAA